MEYKLIEHVQIDRRTVLEWYYSASYNQYKVQVRLYNREVYTKVLDSKHYKIYHNYINERVRYLMDADVLNKEYSMILLDNTMYEVIDKTAHFKEFVRILIPVEGEYYYDIENNIFDLVLDCTIRTGEVFDEHDLVFHNGLFYLDGKVISSIREFEHDDICYEVFDLMHGLNEEQIEYLKEQAIHTLGYNKIEKYVTKKVSLNIDRCY